MAILQALFAALADVIGRVMADVLKDWFSRPDVVGVEYGDAPISEDDLGPLRSADDLLSEYDRVPRDEV